MHYPDKSAAYGAVTGWEYNMAVEVIHGRRRSVAGRLIDIGSVLKNYLSKLLSGEVAVLTATITLFGASRAALRLCQRTSRCSVGYKYWLNNDQMSPKSATNHAR